MYVAQQWECSMGYGLFWVFPYPFLYFMLKAILLNRSKLWRERFGTCQVHSSVSCFLCAHKSCKQFLHKGPYSMKGEGYTVPACQGNCSLTSRTAPWKVEEMDQSSSHWERLGAQLSCFLSECSNQGVVEIPLGTITVSCSCSLKISGSDCVLKVKYCHSRIVATCQLEWDPAEM